MSRAVSIRLLDLGWGCPRTEGKRKPGSCCDVLLCDNQLYVREERRHLFLGSKRSHLHMTMFQILEKWEDTVIFITGARLCWAVAVCGLVSFMCIMCTSLHLCGACDVETIISSVLHMSAVKHKISYLPEVILLLSRKVGPGILVCVWCHRTLTV